MLSNILILLFFLFLLIFSISKWNIHPFIALILIAIGLGLSLGLGGPSTVEVLLQGFSNTLRGIAIIIIVGAFIGEVLQETGGAFRISNTIVKGVGETRLPWAMGFTGYLVSIPVFVDVAYILFQPVIESLSSKSKRPVLFIGLALTAGLTVSHTLIPPTPGPLAVASELGLNLGRMMFINVIVAIFAMTGGILFVIYFVKDAWIPYDEKLQHNFQEKPQISDKTSSGGSSFILDILPIVIPILLIASGSFIQFDPSNVFSNIFEFISLPLVAVLIGAVVAILQLKSSLNQSTINRLVEQAILKSALVIMITGAGGALGSVIKETGVQHEIVHIFAEFPFLGIMLPFLVAALLTISTGSITVSLVASASMLKSMVDYLPVSPEMVAALIGCGSFCVFHANSSFFWLLNRLHEVPPNTLYKTFTLQSLVMGLSGLVGVLILFLLGF